MDDIRGITIDFFMTLARHRGRGRGASLMGYLAGKGLSSDPWEHRVLYDVFEYYGEAYSPDASRSEHHYFWTELTRRLFTRLGVTGPGSERPEIHADSVRELLGPSCLRVFDDAVPALTGLRRRGLPIGIVSNWQRGLEHFCRELDLERHVDFVIGSADVGFAKPDRRIFELAVERMGLPAAAMAHVGDHAQEDAQGAFDAGLFPVLLVRDGEAARTDVPAVRDLRELETLI